MPSLHELQADFRRFVGGEAAPRVVDAICADGLTPEQRLSIYRNASLINLATALEAVFPVVRRLVDPRFFAYAADQFIHEHFPTEPCLTQYGRNFPAFLEEFPAAAGVAYLSDVARLEWSIHQVLLAAPEPPLALSEFVERRNDAANIPLRFHPAVGYLSSPFPIDRIWEVNQSAAVPDAVVVERGSVCLEIRSGPISVRRLSVPSWTFRFSLFGGATLEQAAKDALRLNAGFELSREIIAVFEEGLIVGIVSNG